MKPFYRVKREPALFTIIAILMGVDVCSIASPAIHAEEDQLSDPAVDQPRDIKLLSEIEQRVLPLPLVDGVARHESISNYYWETNVALRYRFDEATRAFTSKKPRPFRAFTLVAGPAGVGKTFIKRGVYGAWLPDDEVWKFDVRELFGEFAERGMAVAKPDVYYHGQVLNRLLSLNTEGRKALAPYIAERAPGFVVVDSLDEIHPDDYYFVLETLERIALHNERPFIHVVVFGRPLAFREYWRDRRSEGLPNGVRGYMLNPPDFRTTGDLLVSDWNYSCWKFGLCRDDAVGGPRPMTLPEFQWWCKCDFSRTGEFTNVKCEPNTSLRPEVHDELVRWSRRHRVVLGVLPNLAGNSILREMVAESVEAKRPFNERDFMNEFFARWLERDTKSDDRPSRLKPEHLDLYLKLLEAIASKYLQENRINRMGYFDVVDDDRVVVEHEGAIVSVKVSRVLNRSGLVTLDPVLPVAARYRFEPFWIHRQLMLMHHDRKARSRQD